jgi:hypothetical protein
MNANPDWELNNLLDKIRAEVRDTSDLTGLSSLDSRVLHALQKVTRNAFVP